MPLLLRASLFATRALGHGHVTNVVVNGVSYEGWDIDSFPYMEDPPTVAAWRTPNTANGYISPESYTTPDIICHVNATNGTGSIPITAGDSINLQWTAWPDTHHGPVVDYLAPCSPSCQNVDKSILEFFKISETSSSRIVTPGSSTAPGNYVLRHELIALHGAHTQGGTQNYMQCFNLIVEGSGSDTPLAGGVLGTELYTPTDPGILVDIYKPVDYTIPGPSSIAGATTVAQAASAITVTGTAIVPGATSA